MFCCPRYGNSIVFWIAKINTQNVLNKPVKRATWNDSSNELVANQFKYWHFRAESISTVSPIESRTWTGYVHLLMMCVFFLVCGFLGWFFCRTTTPLISFNKSRLCQMWQKLLHKQNGARFAWVYFSQRYNHQALTNRYICYMHRLFS